MTTHRRIRRSFEMLEPRLVLTSVAFVDHPVHQASEIRLNTLREADLDGDHDVDLLSGNYWFENFDGQGHFEAHSIPDADIGWQRIVHDIDLDRDVDILFMDHDGIWWLENRGGADLAEARLLVRESRTGRVMTPGDYDSDGDLDIAYAIDEDYVRIAFHDSDSFARRETLPGRPGGDGINQIIATDIEDDGWLDLVVVSDDGGMLSFYRNSPTGFGEFQQPIESGVGEYVYLEDFDGDGDADILTARERLVWHENENGEFGEVHVVNDRPLGAAAASDFDNDGDIDILTSIDIATSGESELFWLLNDGGGFRGRTYFVTDHPLSPLAGLDLDGDADLVVADLDGDSVPEIVALRQRFELSVLRKGPSEYRADIPVVSLPNSFDETIVADLNGDQRADIASVLETDGAIKWFAQSNDQTFAPGEYATPRLSHAGSLSSMVPTDLNGDGDLDLVVSSMGANFYEPINIITGQGGALLDPGGKLFWLENIGGSFHRHEIAAVPALPLGRTTVAANDLDNDGDLDIIVSRRVQDQPGFGVDAHSGQVIWFEHQDGKGSFESEGRQVLRIPEAEILITMFDIDNDGDTDFIYSSQAEDSPVSQFGVYMNEGDGRFDEVIAIDGSELALLAGEFVTSLHSVDYDGDRDTDMVAATDQGGILRFLNHDGRIAFQDRMDNRLTDVEMARVQNKPADVKSSDLDRDGDRDIVVSFAGLGRIVWYENNSLSGDFSEVHQIASNLPNVVTIGIGDVDGDGDDDVVAGSRMEYAAELHWYENRTIGDVNDDGRFNSADLVAVFQRGQYEDGMRSNSEFEDGDWNGDRQFNSSDLVLAFQSGQYELAAEIDTDLSTHSEIAGALRRGTAIQIFPKTK